MGQTSILFADDDRIYREAIGEFLRAQGYHVRLVPDGLEALRAVRDEPPDFLVLDLVMPKVDGGRVCRYLRQDSRFQHIPIVVFSALAARDILGMQQDVSADAYVAKGPLSIVTKNILAAIRHLELYGRSAPIEEAVFGYDGFRPRRLVSELLSMNRRANVLLRILHEGVLEADEEDRIFYVNPSALAMVDADEQALIGARLWEAFGPAYREEVGRTIERLRADPEAERRELAVNLKGRRLTVHFTPLRDDEAYAGLLVLLDEAGHREGPQAT
jgi:twitching motility two-component system response regulator PilH